MSSKTQFFKSGIILTLVALTVRTASMLFGAFISRSVGAEGMGLYTAIMTVYSFAITFASSGISLTVTRTVAAAESEGRNISSIVRSAVSYSLIFSSAAAILLHCGANAIATEILSDPRVESSLRILAPSLIPIALCSVLSGYFVGVKRVSFNASVQVVSQILKIVITVILLSSAGGGNIEKSVSSLCLGICLTEIISFLLILLEYLMDRALHPTRVEKNGEIEVKNIALEALPLAVSAYFRSILTTIEHILIPRRLLSRGESGGEAYSHYGSLHGMALPVVLYPMSPLSSFSGLLVPEFASDSSRGDTERMGRLCTSALNATLTYSAFCTVFLFFFSEELGMVIYNSAEAAKYIRVLAPIVPIMYLDHVTDAMLKGVGDHVYSMWVNITDSLLSVLLVYFLIPALGITGYAVVIIVMEGYNFLLSYRKLMKRVSFRLGILKCFVLPLILAATTARLTSSLIPLQLDAISPPLLIIRMIFALALFILSAYLSKAMLSGFYRKNRI